MKSPNWTYHASIYSPRTHSLVYKDKALGVEMVVTTKRNWVLFPGKEQIHYRIEGDSHRFNSEPELMHALERKWDAMDRERFSLIVHMGRSALSV